MITPKSLTSFCSPTVSHSYLSNTFPSTHLAGRWSVKAVKTSRALKTLCDDSGSAVIEFVILAIPLFLPIVIYLSAIYQSSTVLSDLNELARQTARAYITSPSAEYESARIDAVVNSFEINILRPQGVQETPAISVTCQATPCLTPNSRVQVTATIVRAPTSLSGIFRFLSTQSQIFSASDTQIVDAWR